MLYELHLVCSDFLLQAESRLDPREIESIFAIEHRSTLLIDETTDAEKLSGARLVLMKLHVLPREKEVLRPVSAGSVRSRAWCWLA